MVQTASSAHENDVFISYSRSDTPYIDHLRKILNDAGFQVWMDKQDIIGNARWLDEIFDGIETATKFIFCFSSHSMTSFVCQLELAHARALGKPIIPVMLDQPPKEREASVIKKYGLELCKQERTPFDIDALNGRNLMEIHQQNYWEGLKAVNWVFYTPDDEQLFKSNLLAAMRLDLDYLRFYNSLNARLREWRQDSRKPRFLLRGATLDEALRWMAADQQVKPLTAEQLEFIQLSKTARRRRLGVTTLGLATIAVILAMLGLEAVNQNAARQRNAQIIAARQLADAASQSDIGIERVALAVAANAFPDVPVEAQQALLDAVNTVAPSQVYVGDDGLVFIGTLTVGTDGRVYMSGENGTIIAYNPDSTTATRFGPIEQPSAFQGALYDAEWDEFDLAQDAYLVSTLENDRAVFVWDVTSGELTGTITFATPPIETKVARHVSIAASKLNESIVIWDVQTQRTICTVVQPNIFQFALSPDARILLLDSIDADNPVMQYDAQTCAYQKSHSFDTDTLDYSVNSLFIMDDNNTVYGQAVVTDKQTFESKSYILARWTLEDNTLTPILEEYSDVDYLLLNAISADGHRALLESDDTLFVVDTAQGRLLMTLGTGSPLTSAAFSADGARLFVMVSDWRIAQPDEPIELLILFAKRRTAVFAFDIDPFSEPVTRLATAEQVLLSADATRVARINGNRADIIDVASGQTITTLRGHLNPIRLMAYSPDGQWVATSDGNTEHFIWSIPTGELQHQLVMDNYSGVRMLLFSPNSNHLFIAGNENGITNGDASVWDVKQGTKITEFDTFELNTVAQAVWFDNNTISFVDTENNNTLRFLRVGQADDTLELLGDTEGEATVLIDVTPDGRLVRVDSRVSVYALDTLPSYNLDGTLVQVSNQLPTAYGTPQGIHVEGDYAFVFYPRALVVMPLLTRGADAILDPVNNNPLRQVFSTWSDVQAWRFTTDGVLALYPDGTLERWHVPVGYDAAKQFLQKHRFILPLTCVQQREVGLVENCTTPDDNYHRFAFNVPAMPDATPIQIARTDMPTPTYVPTATVVFDDALPAAEQLARSIAQEDLPFSIPTVPTLEGFVPDFYFVNQGDECGIDSVKPIIAPGETCLEISYTYDDEVGTLAFILTASESPFATLEEWHTSSEVASYSFQLYRTRDGLLFARTAITTVSAAVVIDGGIYYSIFPFSADTLTDREYFTLISQLVDVPLTDLDRAELVTQALALKMPQATPTPRAFTLADLDFAAQTPSNVAAFTLDAQKVVDNKAANATRMDLLGITSEASLVLTYRSGAEVITVHQEAISYSSLEAWIDAVDLVRHGTLTDIHDTAVLLVPVEANLIAHAIQDGVLVSFSTHSPRSTLFAFIEAWLALQLPSDG